jgi:hypothetical protein
MVTPPVVVSLFDLPFTTAVFSKGWAKGWANEQARLNQAILANGVNAVEQIE